MANIIVNRTFLYNLAQFRKYEGKTWTSSQAGVFLASLGVTVEEVNAEDIAGAGETVATWTKQPEGDEAMEKALEGAAAWSAIERTLIGLGTDEESMSEATKYAKDKDATEKNFLTLSGLKLPEPPPKTTPPPKKSKKVDAPEAEAKPAKPEPWTEERIAEYRREKDAQKGKPETANAKAGKGKPGKGKPLGGKAAVQVPDITLLQGLARVLATGLTRQEVNVLLANGVSIDDMLGIVADGAFGQHVAV